MEASLTSNKQGSNSSNSVSLDAEKAGIIKLLGIAIVIAAFSLFAAQSWKGDSGIPGDITGDLSMHSYLSWATASNIRGGNFFFDWDYKSNALLSRGRPILPYLLIGPFVMAFGLLNGISYFVILCYFLLGIGMYLLGKKLNFDNSISLFVSLSMLLSYALILEVNWAGGIHRLLTYALLPWILICFINKNEIKYVAYLAILLSIVMLTHPLNGIWFIVILLALYAFEVIENKIKNNAKHITLILSLVAVGLVTISFFGPLLIEQANGSLNKPPYQLQGEKTISEGDGPIPSSFFDRRFGLIGTSSGSKEVFGYIGVSILLLGLAGFLIANPFRLPFLLLNVFFYLTLVSPEFFPPVLQAYHYARPIFLISFFFTIMAAFTVNTITQKLQLSKILKMALVVTLFIAVFIDLSPGINSFPNSGIEAPLFKNIFVPLKTTNKIMTARLWISLIGAPYSTSDFIQIGEENTNPEYGSNIRSLNTTSILAEYKNKFYLLGVSRYIGINYDRNETFFYSFNTTQAFMPSKVVLIKNTSITAAEEIFEQLVSQVWFAPDKVGFLLAREEVDSRYFDYVLVPRKTKSNEITMHDMPALFASASKGKELPWRKGASGALEVLVEKPGWIFTSQMWYPHWRVNGKPVQEAGGGLIAFYLDAPGTYTIYWERPWYDYVFWAISLATLALLAYTILKPKKTEELLAKIIRN